MKITSQGKLLRRHQLGAGHLKRKKGKSALGRQRKNIEFFATDARKFKKVLGI
ncbi:hypothetical protein HYS92_02530 [Candidatus Daviesbacteria bacterium]|nr:hypothetical protein [Candidatus Daviesbacteria bacterium]